MKKNEAGEGGIWVGKGMKRRGSLWSSGLGGFRVEVVGGGLTDGVKARTLDSKT